MKRTRADKNTEGSVDSGDKRNESGSGNGGGGSRQIDWKIQVRFIMKNSMAGQVIGSRGATIQKLRDDFDVNVQLYAEEGPERLLFFESADFENITACICEYAKIVVRDDNYCEHKMLVWKHHAGGIIGNKGETINELRKKYTCNVQMFKECCPNSTDRVVRVSGDLDKVTECLTEIIDMVQKMDRPSPGAENRYNPKNHDPISVDNYGGFSGSNERGGGGGGSGGYYRGDRDGGRGGRGGGRGGDDDDGGRRDKGGKRFPPVPPANQMPSYEKLFFLVYGQFPPANYPIPQMPMQMAYNQVPMNQQGSVPSQNMGGGGGQGGGQGGAPGNQNWRNNQGGGGYQQGQRSDPWQ